MRADIQFSISGIMTRQNFVSNVSAEESSVMVALEAAPIHIDPDSRYTSYKISRQDESQ